MAELAEAYPQQVRVWDFRAALNDESTQGQMLRWIGVAEPVLAVGEVTHASSPAPVPAELQPEPEPTKHLIATGVSWWQELELEEMRQDLNADRQLTSGNDVAAAGHTAPDRVEQGLVSVSTTAMDVLSGTGAASGVAVGALDSCLPCKTPARDRFQCYSDAVAWDRWHTEKPLRIVDYQLGFPIVIEEPNGYPAPPPVRFACSCTVLSYHR